MTQGISKVRVLRTRTGRRSRVAEFLAVEEPLEIRLGVGPASARTHQQVSITMRTPGHDHELAAGFLFSEGIVSHPREIAAIRQCGPSPEDGKPRNVVRVDLAPGISTDTSRLKRHSFMSSSCGVCGKTSIEALRSKGGFISTVRTGRGPRVDESTLCRLPELLRGAQGVFELTGGLHASGVFDSDGRLRSVREDVGRHNALDKLIGAAFMDGRLPLGDAVLLLSGRASFELIQKAAMAGIRFVAAVGAPSSLAVELARETGMTLVGFLRKDREGSARFNIYHGAGRVRRTRDWGSRWAQKTTAA